ncbi:MAG: PEP-CTERM sorting domain-containing protein, partial [Desulfobacteraceae bacterium]|nr:PEP-CTERM sorting domain-containing protein [Desulfobacteraceae bacterium]
INFDTFSISTVVLWNPRIEIRRDEGSFSVVDGHSSSNFDSASLFSDEVRISLYDTTGSAIIDDSLPESLDLTALTTGSMLFTTWGWGDGGPDLYAEYHEVLGSIDSIQACPVPEPASIFLFSFGLVSLVGCYRLLGREKGQ